MIIWDQHPLQPSDSMNLSREKTYLPRPTFTCKDGDLTLRNSKKSENMKPRNSSTPSLISEEETGKVVKYLE
jgi:hypothetical protein